MWKKKSSGSSLASESAGIGGQPLKSDSRSVVSTDLQKNSVKLAKGPLSPASATQPASNKLNTSVIKSAYIWDVIIPPSVNSFQGHFLPKMLNHRNRERRLSVEVRTPSTTLPTLLENSSVATEEKAAQEDFTIVRFFVPAASKEAKAVQDTAQAIVTTAATAAKNVKETSAHVIQVSKRAVDELKLQSQRTSADAVESSEMDNKSVSSVSTLGFRGTEEEDGKSIQTTASLFDKNRATPKSRKDLASQSPNWIEKDCVSLEDIAINKRVKNICVVTTIHDGKKNKTREIIFSNEREAAAFDKLIRREKRNAAAISRKRLKEALGNGKISPMENLKILGEIVSAYDLPIGDLISSDPYVVVRLGEREIHRTKHISKTCDPIWTVKSGSLFLIEITTKDLFRCFEGICFEVRDYDVIGSDSRLGIVLVPPKVVYEAASERLEFKLQTMTQTADAAAKKTEDSQGTLVLRFRHATLDDLNFMAELGRQEQADAFWKPKDFGKVGNLFSRNSKVEHGETYYRVRPGPDPRRQASETEWMTSEQIERETFQKSHGWLAAGSGTIGQLYVEVLGCNGLPNMDATPLLGTTAFGNLTDTFVVLVYEDALVQTDMITDCLNPRWLPWTNRAFIFNLFYPSSELFIGVFDFDSSDIDDHDPIGRVTVDVAKLVPKVEYVLTYNLYESNRDPTRKAQGTITLRIRVEFDEREMLLKTLEFPPEMHINCRRRKDWELARYTCQGKERMDQYSLTTIAGHVKELTDYQFVTFYIQEAVTSLLLWRGHRDVLLYIPFFPQAGRIKISLPIHSMLAFVIGVSIVERPHLLPSIMMGCISWIMLATLEFRLKNPSRWRTCKSFTQLCWVLATGRHYSPRAIKAFENEKESIAFERAEASRILALREAAEESRLMQLKIQEEVTKEMNELNPQVGSDASFSLDPFRPYLYPLQMQLEFACDCLLVVRNVIIWEELYLSFWITFGALVLSIAFLFIPWGFLLKWSARLVVWALLGPWMKLIDVYYLRVEALSEEELKLQKEKVKADLQKAASSTIKEARMRKEDEVKMRDMKKQRFGKYMVRIPLYKTNRIRDFPLSSSYANLIEEDKLSMGERAVQEAREEIIHVPGQHLVGVMIPELFHVSSIALGQPTKKAFIQSEASTVFLASEDSNSSAAIKVGTVIIGASVITWCLVPIMSSFVRTVFFAD